MPQEIEISIKPDKRASYEALRAVSARKLHCATAKVAAVQVLRRSLDSRKRPPIYRLRVRVYLAGETIPKEAEAPGQRTLGKTAKEVHIIGAGPAGYFAALELLNQGCKPIIFDRGKDVQARRRDLKAIQQDGIVNPNSNYCFGEGGAGTYSDGKLYTRAHKRGNILSILQTLVRFGAHPDILIDAHPHIGSNKLPNIIAAIREHILDYGGEIHFNHLVNDIVLHDGQVNGLEIKVDEQTKFISVEKLILATGHSARDIFQLLKTKDIQLEFKDFAIGVRIEHPQPVIDEIQYGKAQRGLHLPAASYRVADTLDGCGVFSFCMCPGGLIVPAATQPGEIVVNGMSLSRRDSPFANSGVVVGINSYQLERLGYQGVWGGLKLQQTIEQGLFDLGDGSQKAPAQRLTDFLSNSLSSNLPKTSYIPGLFECKLNDHLPQELVGHLKRGIHAFNKKLKGYITEEAIVVGAESRTSSPVRISRNPDTGESPNAKGLYPCGEGAGFAGGILSAAMDGIKIAKLVASSTN